MSTGRLASLVRERGDLLRRVLLATVQAAAIAWFWPGRGLPLDDAWIHQVVARTFAETGTLGYAPGQHGAAATSYLWAALLAVEFKVLHIGPDRWALLLNAVAALATGQLLLALVERASPEAGDAAAREGSAPVAASVAIAPVEWRTIAFVVTLLACVSPNILWLTCSGMEAMPFVALSLTALWAATHAKDRPRLPMVAGLAAGALALLRPEAAPLGGLLVLHALFRRQRRPNVIAIALPWAAGVALYVGSNLLKTGHALPSTLAGRRWLWFEMSAGLSRTDQALEFLDAWATRLGSYTLDTGAAAVWTCVGIASYGAIRLAWTPRGKDDDRTDERDGLRLLLGWALFHAAFYALLLPTPGHGGRYQPLTPLLFALCLPLGASFVLRDLAHLLGAARGTRFALFAAVGIAPWILLSAPVLRSLRDANALAVAHIQATELAAGAAINELPEGHVASFDIGGSGFVARRRVLDLGGLSDPRTASLLETGRLAPWLAANQVKWIVLPEPYDATLPVFEDYRTRLHLADYPGLELEAVRAFETPFDRWVPSIRATWNAAPRQVVYAVRHVPGAKTVPEVPLVARDARRVVVDPAHLVPRRERVIAEHMLATLAAWHLPIDVRLRPTRSQGPDPIAAHTDAACAIALGPWGIDVDACALDGETPALRAMAYEQTGRYLDVGDLGGALRSLPHVIAQARRRVDPTFHPPLAPLMLPAPGGVHASTMAAGRLGLALALGVLALALAMHGAVRRGATLDRLAALVRTRLAIVVPFLGLFGALQGCAGDTSVAHALPRGRGAVEAAIASGASVQGDRATHRVPLLEAATLGDAEIVALLLAYGAKTDVRAPDGASPVHLAARRGHQAALVLLLSAVPSGDARKAMLDAPAGVRGRTALHDAAAATSLDAVAALLDAGAAPTIADAFGQTALHLLGPLDAPHAAQIAARLLAANADPAATDARGFTALHAAAVSNSVPLLRVLIDSHPALIDVTTPLGETALDIALRYGRDHAAELLLQMGAVPSRADAWPPLHDAARMDDIERAASLLAAGADVTRQRDDRTALDVAVASKSKRVEALLRDSRR